MTTLVTIALVITFHSLRNLRNTVIKSNLYLQLKKKYIFHLDISKATRLEWNKRKQILKSVFDASEDDGQMYSVQEAKDPIDVNKIYMEYEAKCTQREHRLKGPEGLKLKEFEVNLRCHRIVAGVYSVEHFEQPEQDICLNPKSFLRTSKNMDIIFDYMY